jgi:uncharacterized membrane protein
MVKQDRATTKSGFRHFFFRGLTILLPSILTIWILFVVYQFMQYRIAGPINEGVRIGLSYSPWPIVLETEVLAFKKQLERDNPALLQTIQNDRQRLRQMARRTRLDRYWQQYAFPLDLIGLIIAILAIYMAGAFLGSFIGRRLYRGGERLIGKVPLIKQVYPSVKQVTDFLVGSDDAPDKMKFSRVVGVEYPRIGIWSIGLVTGSTMRAINDRFGKPCVTVFVPSSPTPFTGYTITVAEEDTIELPITIEQALRFTISGGVIVPPEQMMPDAHETLPPQSLALNHPLKED